MAGGSGFWQAEGSAVEASTVGFDPTGLAVVTGTDVQAALEELDAAVDAAGGSGGATAAEVAYYMNRAALLEPLAIEKLQAGAFSYVIGSSATKWLLSSWGTRLGASGRLDMRESREPVPLRGVTVTGTQPGGDTSTGAFIDPTLATYADPKETFFERMNAIAETQTRYVPVVGGSTFAPLIPGPYGNILVGFTFHDSAWLGISTPRGPAGSLLPIHDEIGDASGDDLRMSRKLYMPVSKNIMAGLLTGVAGGPQAVEAGMAYIICPSTWGEVADPLAPYDFRDDFMGGSIDTASTWTRAQSTAGNVEINTDFAACKVRGNGSWGTNGMFSQAGQARATGLTFVCDVFPAASPSANLIVGFHDGAGQSYSDFAHGVYFTTDGVNARLQIFENGTSRGNTGPTPGFAANKLYRVRITLGATNTQAVYEMQGGSEYPAIGGSSWTDVTPGTTSSSTTPLHAGVSVEQANDNYISDPRIYS